MIRVYYICTPGEKEVLSHQFDAGVSFKNLTSEDLARLLLHKKSEPSEILWSKQSTPTASNWGRLFSVGNDWKGENSWEDKFSFRVFNRNWEKHRDFELTLKRSISVELS